MTVAQVLLVCGGGALGSGARFLVGELAVRRLGTGFPWGTLAVNLIGSLLLSVILAASFEARLLSQDARLFLGTGVMGGFTTYSTFNAETIALVREGRYGTAAAYVAATVAFALLAGVLGLLLGRALAGRA